MPGSYQSLIKSIGVFFIMDNKQPKDFAPVTIDEAIKESYKVAPLWMKVLYQMNEHPILNAIIYIGIGIIIGITSSKF
jgi:hypothetical protein